MVLFISLTGLFLQEDELLSLARSLLLAWSDPLALLSSEASSLAHPERNTINSKTQELQDNIKSLGTGLEHLVHKVISILYSYTINAKYLFSAT